MILDSQEVSVVFASKLIKENGLSVLMYLCSISLTLDVKSICIKLIDVLCCRYTNLIKQIRIDTDLIPFLSEILLPKKLEYDIELIKKKRYLKLKQKREELKQE